MVGKKIYLAETEDFLNVVFSTFAKSVEHLIGVITEEYGINLNDDRGNIITKANFRKKLKKEFDHKGYVLFDVSPTKSPHFIKSVSITKLKVY